jgi:tetratricopeptide (TPR) repeat protein
MRTSAERAGTAGVLATLLLAAPASAQFREYYVRGRVVDGSGQPLAEVAIALQDSATSRAYNMKTDAGGAYKLAGLPHGVYAVSFRKPGYAAKQDKWDLSAPQASMKRIEMPDVVLVSEAQAQVTLRAEETGTRNKQAAEKIRAGDFDGALQLLQDALQRTPDDADVLYLIGLGHAGKKQWSEAAAALKRVTELSPDFAPAYFQLAVCHGKLGQPERALALYDKHLELEPGHATSAYNSGLILFEANRIDEALARFERGLASNPEDPELQEMLGRCYVHQGKLREAVEHLERARARTTDADKRAFLDQLIRDAQALIR